ncbi:MAG: uracil-DNA glycosylase [Treponema sp.]|jgi:DNA polymerase|nr:uracil-DNA glycosylase [Treponema sp.]
MIAEQKTVLARFLDTAGKYLEDGYRRPGEECAVTAESGGEAPDPRRAAPLSATPGDTPGETPGDTPGDTPEGIAADIRSCRSCPLEAARTNAVPGEGAEHPLVLVIGEGPGQDEDRTGRPFVGRAGQLLDKMLAAIDLRREENCFITNVVKCRPPGNRDPEPMEALCCKPFLRRQISCLRPRSILCVGKVAANLLLETTEQAAIGSLRGRFFDYTATDTEGTGPIPVLATYHPSALLRNEDLKRPAWEDLKLLRAKLEELKGP